MVLARIGPSVARALASRSALRVILGLAAALRLAHLGFVSSDPFFDSLRLDHLYYDAWGERIAGGDVVGSAAFFVDPLYAYFLGAVYFVFGHDLFVARLLQVGMGVATVWLTADIGRRVFGEPARANAAALVVAVYVPMVHDAVAIEKSSLAAVLVTGAMALYLRATPRALLFAGVVIGLAALARANALLLALAGVVGLLLERPTHTEQEEREGTTDDSPPPPHLRASIFAAGAAAVLGLVAVRNAIVIGEPSFTPASAGANLYIAQHAENDAGTYRAPPFVRPDPAFEEEDFRREAERRSGHPLTPGEASAFWREQAIDAMLTDPARALERTARKVYLLAHSFEVPDNDNVDALADISPVLAMPLVWMGQLLPFALLGLGAARRARPLAVLAVAAGLWMFGLALFFVVGRFRAPMVPMLAVLGVAGASWLLELAEEPSRGRALSLGALVLGLLVALNFYPPWLSELRLSGAAIETQNLAAVRLAAGDEAEAMRLYEKAVGLSPRTVLGARRILADMYARAGRVDEAEAQLRALLEDRPGDRRALAALARLRGEPVAEAPVGDTLAELEARVRSGPYDEGESYRLGELMEARSTPAHMIEFWSAHRATDPKPQTSLYFWAVGLERSNDDDAAIAKLEEALEVDPAHEMSAHRLGTILERRGRYDEALVRYALATEIHPEFRAAHEGAARVLDALGRTDEANERRRLAAESNPGTIRRFYYWGRFLLAHGRREAAIAELERAVAASPSDAEARALLEEARP